MTALSLTPGSQLTDTVIEMDTVTDRPSLPALERLLADHRHGEALQMALQILHAIDNRAGRLDTVETGTAYPGSTDADFALVFTTRFAAAFGRLLTEQDLSVPANTYELLLNQYRWIDLIFSLSGFRTSDNFLALIAKDAGNGRSTFRRR